MTVHSITAQNPRATIDVEINSNHFVSDPEKPFNEMGIETIQFGYSAVDGENVSPEQFVEATPYQKSREGGIAYRATLNVTPGKEYKVRTRVTDKDGKVTNSEPFTVSTSENIKLYLLEYKIIEAQVSEAGVKKRETPIEGATFTLNPGQGDEQTFDSRSDGLVYFFNLPAGEYTYEVTKSGFQTRTGAINIPSDNQTGTLGLRPE